jgi:transposase
MRPRKRRRSRRPAQLIHLGKPHGILAPRVQAVGPEHFGIVAIDPAKARSYWMLADFYGRVLIPMTTVEHTRPGFEKAIAELREALAAHDLRDLVVAIEQTGAYHRPVKRAYAAAGFDTRTVHPCISRSFREVGAYDTKTDNTDLEGIFRAAINGFGLQQPPADPLYTALQMWARHRRDLVQKTTLVCCQILEHLEAFLPGYTRCFEDVFMTKIALLVPIRYPNPAAVAQAGLDGLIQLARLAKVRFQTPTLLRILGWAQDAPAPGDDAVLHQRLFGILNDDRINKEKLIQSSERELVDLLVQTPYVRLLALAGINVVLASEFAGEAGPMVNYAKARTITGRAGLYPWRYQSDEVDYSGGLARRGNRRLRQALLLAADTLIRCNDHFRTLAAKWRDQGTDPREVHVRVAGRFARIAFQLVTGTEGFDHPACQDPSYVIKKLNEFHENHNISEDIAQTNLQRAIAQLPCPKAARQHPVLHAPRKAARARPGRGPTAPQSAAWDAPRTAARAGSGGSPPAPQAAVPAVPQGPGRGSRGRGPKPLNEILPMVLQQLGGDAARVLESNGSGETP